MGAETDQTLTAHAMKGDCSILSFLDIEWSPSLSVTRLIP